MATLKLKHLILYFFMFALLYYADVPGGALISIAAWFQICILLWKKDYTSKNQTLVFIYFLTLIPLFVFLGSSSSFISIYFNEGAWLFMLMSLSITFILTVLTILTAVFSTSHFNSDSNIVNIYKSIFLDFKIKQRQIMACSLFLLFTILIPLQFRQDYKISLAIILIHLYLNQKQIRDLVS
jgi:hypothetical protein